MTDWRHDPILGHRSIIAPGRDDRPADPELSASDPGGGTAERREAQACPFCPGAERELAPILEEIEGPEGWIARAVENRWPFVSAPDRQEVLIESRAHDRTFADFGPGEMWAAVELWWRRARVARALDPGARLVLFRNEGREAGSSRTHPHAQLVIHVSSTAPKDQMRARLVRHHEGTGSCALCAEASNVPDRTLPLVGGWRAVLLDAPLDPFHLRLIPERHTASFVETDPEERDALAASLRGLLPALRTETEGRAWNLLVRDLGAGEGPGLHWHVEIRPRFSRTAGWEQTTGHGVCALDPQIATERLRIRLAANSSSEPPAQTP